MRLSEDGIIEGIETDDGRIIGVQFHPEALPGTVWDRVFAHLVAISRSCGERGPADRLRIKPRDGAGAGGGSHVMA